MKILLAKRRALGDTVLLSSSVALLHKKFPNAEISVLVPGAFLPALEGNPSIKNLWSFEEGLFSLLLRIRKEKFDYFFQLHASPGTRWLGWVSAAKSVHMHQQNSETEKAYGKHPHALEWDAFFFRSVFGESIDLPAPLPEIFLSEQEKEDGKQIWRKVGADPSRIVFLGLGASRPTKRWLPSHFARLAELMRDRLEAVPAIVVGPGEIEEKFAAAVINEMRVRGFRPLSAPGKGDFVHLAGLGVRDLARALSAVKIYVGNDSGPKHMAVALGVSTITMFGPEDPIEWHPYDRSQHPVFFQENLACRKEDYGRWCSIAICNEETEEKHRCMRDIDPLDVFTAIEKKWRRI